MMTRQTLAFIMKMLRPFVWSIAVMFFLVVVWTIDMSLRPYLLKVILNRVAERPATGISEHIATPVIAYLSTLFFLLAAYRL